MVLFPLLFAAAAARPHALTPHAPAVSAADAARLLRTEYAGEKPRLHGDWAAAGEETAGTRRSLCADSGQAAGLRFVAVCTVQAEAGHGTPGRVDLFVLRPATSRGGRAQVQARYRGIATGGFGTPGPVRLMTLGPGTLGFAVTSAFSTMGWLDESVSLYVEQNGQLRQLLEVATAASNSGVCMPGDDPAGRRCRRQSIALTCALQVDASRLEYGFYPLQLRVTGERAGRPVDRVIAIPHDAFGYRVAARVLETQGCNRHG